jgi:hypothetical protein
LKSRRWKPRIVLLWPAASFVEEPDEGLIPIFSTYRAEERSIDPAILQMGRQWQWEWSQTHLGDGV